MYKLLATGGWTEQDNPSYKQLQSLLEYYRTLAQREKFEREKKRSSKRKSSYRSLTDKYSHSSSFSSLMSHKSVSPLSPFTPKVRYKFFFIIYYKNGVFNLKTKQIQSKFAI